MKQTLLHIIIILSFCCCKNKEKDIKIIQISELEDSIVTEKTKDTTQIKLETNEKRLEIGIAYVTAENGLIYREKPDINSNKLGQFEFGSKLGITEKTGIQFEVKENKKSIKGEWIKVFSKKHHWQTGYAFGGFMVDSLKADFSKLPIDFSFLSRKETKQAEIEFQKINLLFTKIKVSEFNEYGHLKSKTKIDSNKIKPLKSVGSTKEGGYFLIKTDTRFHG